MSIELKPLRIGRIVIDFPVVLAALAGYSDLAYRLICRSLSAPFCTTEAMLDRALLQEGKLRRTLIRLDKADHPVAGQLMGNEPAIMAKAAAVLDEMGFDAVDLNFACPVRKVLARNRGGIMMNRPEEALDIVRAVLEAVPGRPVMLKLRRAFFESDQDAGGFWKIAYGAFKAGVAAICVHGRSVDQKYRGRADWGFIARVKREFGDRTVLGSGDIHTAADALRMIGETGVDGVIAARGAIGNPWIFTQARELAAGREPRPPGIEEQRELIARHFRMTCDLHGEKRGIKTMRGFGVAYARLHPHPAKVRMAVVKVKSTQEWREFLKAFYGG